MNLEGKIFDIKLEDGTWVKCKCIKFTDEIRQFKALNGSGYIDIDWMEYMDQCSLGRIKEDRHANLGCPHDIENTAKRIVAFAGEKFKTAKEMAIEAIESRIGRIQAMTEGEYLALKSNGFEGNTEADETAFTIDGYYFAGYSFAADDPYKAAVTEVACHLKRDIGFILQITYDQYRETKAVKLAA